MISRVLVRRRQTCAWRGALLRAALPPLPTCSNGRFPKERRLQIWR